MQKTSSELLKNYKNKKILSFSTRPLWKMHYLMELSLIKYLSKNNKIICLTCNHGLDSCEANVYGRRDICEECISLQKSIRHRIHESVIFDESEIFSPFNAHPGVNYESSSLQDINKLINLKIDDYEIGKAILNHIIPNYGLNANLSDPSLLRITRRLLYSLIETYLQLNAYIKKNNIDCGLIFNGRFPHESAFLAACQKNSIDYIIHERASDPNKIGVYINCRPHFLWEIAANAEKIDLANISKENLSEIKEFSLAPYKKWQDQHFTGNQVKDYMPTVDKKVISIFLSTQEEFVAVPGGPEEPTFYDKLKKLLGDIDFISFLKDYIVIVRDHPNSLKFSQSEKYLDLLSQFEFIRYYPPESSIDSYALINASEIVMTFGSTVGLEALIKGIKVICLTKLYAAYAVNLPGVLVYDPFNPEIEKIINFAKTEVPKERIIETSLKISAALINHDVSIPGWSYKKTHAGVEIAF